MPANPEHLHSALAQIRVTLASADANLRSAQGAAMRLFEQVAADPGALAAMIAEAQDSADGSRRAVPAAENLAAAFDPLDATPARPVLAADGSQVVPSRHDEIPFGVINVASVLYVPGSGTAPEVTTRTELLFGDVLYSATGDLLSEGDLALRRDLAERQALRDAVRELPRAILLVDGPLELWGAKDVSTPGAFEAALRSYLQALRELHAAGATVAGYVDKPGADLLVRSLELVAAARNRHAPSNAPHFRGVTDRWMFGRLLAPGQRSAIFELRSSSVSRFTDDLALHFFYLNVGRPAQPFLARVEIPAWVANDPARLNELHAAILTQCALLGDRPYPYILHRAHESARIAPAEKEQIKLRLLLEMRNGGLEPESISPKSSVKAA